MRRLKWKRESQYAISANEGEFAIAKFFLDGCTLYLLTRGRGKDVINVKYDEDPDVLREIALKLHNEAKP